jgi:protoheme IX farnesyltransferase
MVTRTQSLDMRSTAALRRIADYIALAKPRLVALNLVSAFAGFYVASAGVTDTAVLLHLLVGVAFAAAGALALNQYFERDIDAKMRRTRQRPLPDGRLQPMEGLLFGSLITLVGLAHLAFLVNPISAAVTAVTVVTYLFVYTPLKRKSSLCTVVGAVPGALPPVTGWVAATGEFGVGAWVMFAILFLWQLPHSLAIAWLYRDDYARAGLRLLPIVDRQGGSTERQVVMNCLALLAVALLPTLIGMAGSIYFFGSLALGGGFLWCGLRLAISRSPAAAGRLLFASFVYLPALLALMTFDKAL